MLVPTAVAHALFVLALLQSMQQLEVVKVGIWICLLYVQCIEQRPVKELCGCLCGNLKLRVLQLITLLSADSCN